MFLDASNQRRLVTLAETIVKTRRPVLWKRDPRGQAARLRLLAELDDGLILPRTGEEDGRDKGAALSGVECAREEHESSRVDDPNF